MKPFAAKRRARRMQDFVRRMNIAPGLRVLDLGGTPWIWNHVPVPLDITFVNLKHGQTWPADHPFHRFQFQIGDACDLPHLSDKSFDIVFSNSVIEHVGERARRRTFAEEAKRLARAYWIQTPVKSFPIEAHSGMPYWWYYPAPMRQYFVARWKERLPPWTEMIEGTTFVSNREMDELFPGASSYAEWVLGFRKSMTRYVPYRRNDTRSPKLPARMAINLNALD